MDKNKLVNEVIEKLKESDTLKQLINELVENNEIDSRRQRSDEEIVELFKTKGSDNNHEYCLNCSSVKNLRFLADNKATVNAFLYNEENDNFELYPFKVLFNNEDDVVLIGLKNLGDSTWEECKDRKFKFVFSNGFGDNYMVLHGNIPTKEEVESISKEDIIKGNWYWTSTPYFSNTSNAWYVSNNGNVTNDHVSSSNGVVPYIVLDNIMKEEYDD